MKRCSREGCDKKPVAKGLCPNHYAQFKRYDPTSPRCVVDGCDNAQVYTRLGLCNTCYARQRKSGTVNWQVARKGEPIKWLESLIIEVPDDECRDWPFGKQDGGYGMVTLNGKVMTSSRAMLILVSGKDPEGLVARHSCDRPSCVAPWHLSWGSHADNFYEMLGRGASRLQEFGKEEFIEPGYCPHCDHCSRNRKEEEHVRV